MKQSPIIEELRKDITEEFEGWNPNFGEYATDRQTPAVERIIDIFQSYLAKCVGKDESVNNYKVWGDVFGEVRNVLRAEIRKRGGIK